MNEKKENSYAQAIEELAKIVNAIETESIDVDVLAAKVKRATYLIKFCKGKLKTTEEEVKEVLSEIEEKQETEPKETDLEPF